MDRYTLDQRLQIVETFYQNQSSIRQCHRALRKFYGAHNRPTEQTIRRIIARFRTNYSLHDSKPARRKNVRTLENIAVVSQSFEKDPNMSIRCRSQELGLCPSTIWKILREDLGNEKVDNVLVGSNYKTDGEDDSDNLASEGPTKMSDCSKHNEDSNDDMLEVENEHLPTDTVNLNSSCIELGQGRAKIKLTPVDGSDLPKKRRSTSTITSLKDTLDQPFGPPEAANNASDGKHGNSEEVDEENAEFVKGKKSTTEMTNEKS